MEIAAIQHFSLLDYPGMVSAILFTQGCPLRCTYCHNKAFQSASSGRISFSDVLTFLRTRVGLLDSVVFSGGEPLIQHDLYDAMLQVKDLGFLIGLHTSGVIPAMFEKVLPIVDWIGFDIKTRFDKYEAITKIPNSGNLAKESFFKLVTSTACKNYEIRTTVDARNINFTDLLEIAKFLQKNKVKKWTLQQCILRNTDTEDDVLPLPTNEEIKELEKLVSIKIRS